MATDAIAAAKLAVYIILVQPSVYCLWKHGKTGFLGWFYVHVFCVLRIVTGGVGLHGAQTGTGAVVLNSIGLSPLLLATAGVFYEVRRATQPRFNRKLNLFLEIQFHMLVGTGMVLIIVAIVNLMSNKSPSTMKVLLDVGSAISALTWLLLVVWVLSSLSHTGGRPGVLVDRPTMNGGRILRIGVLVALPLIALRLGYAIAFLQLRISDPSSSFLSSTAAQVLLSVVPEMLCVACLLGVGVITRSLKGDIKRRDELLPIGGETEMK